MNKNASKSSFIRSKLMQYMIPIIIALLVVFFQTQNSRFLSVTNLANVARQCSVIAIMAIGQTIVIISGNINLAEGSMVALIGCFAANQILRYGFVTGTLMAIALAVLCGLCLGVLVAKCHIPAFIVTLGAMGFFSGAVYIYTGGSTISGSEFPKAFLEIGSGNLGFIPISFLIAIFLYILANLFMKYVRAGREIYAVGGNQEAALFSGINVDLRKIIAYVLDAVFTCIAALILISRLAVGQPTLGDGYQLQTIAAAVIGGTSFTGGEGTIFGTALGVILVSIINNGLNLMRVSSYLQMLINGAIIIAAVGFDVWQKKR